jgi:hypothetical protein
MFIFKSFPIYVSGFFQIKHFFLVYLIVGVFMYFQFISYWVYQKFAKWIFKIKLCI